MEFDNYKMLIAQNIKFLRKTNKFTQVELANACGMGRIYLSEIERGKRNFTLKTLYKIAIALNLTPIDILTLNKWGRFRG